MELKTNEYRISFGNQSAFVWTWLQKNWTSKKNRQRFMIYTSIIWLLMLFGIAPSYGQLSIGLGNYLIWFAILMLLVFVFSAAVIAGIMVFIIGPLLIFAWQSMSYLFGPASKRRQSVALSASGLTKHVGETSSHLEWNQIFDLVETRGTLLLFTNPNCAMIVPKSAFPSPEEAEQFTKAVQSNYANAKSVF